MAYMPPNPVPLWPAFFPSAPVVPKLYYDALSPEQRIKKLCEELHRLCEYANMLGVNINSDRELLKRLIETIPENIRTEVEEQITNLLESGELEEFVQRTIEEIYGTYIPADANFTIVGVKTQEQAGVWKSMQCGTVLPSGMIFQVAINSDPESTDLSRAYIMAPDTGNVLVEKTIDLGHANSCAYTDGRLYIVKGESTNDIVVIDATTLDYIETLTSEISLYGIEYVPNVGFFGINQWKGADAKYLYALNDDFTLDETITVDANCGRSSADLGLIDDMLCVVSLLPAQLIYLTTEGTVLGVSQINQNASQSYFISEPEWVHGDRNKFYLGARLFSSYVYGTGNHGFFASSFNNNGLFGSPTQISVSQIDYLRMFVDPSTQNFKRFGTYERPYQNIYEALNNMQNSFWNRAYIQLRDGDYSNYGIRIENIDRLVTIEKESSAPLLNFAGLQATDLANLVLKGITFNTPIQSGDYEGRNLALVNSRVLLENAGTTLSDYNAYVDRNSELNIADFATVTLASDSNIYGMLTNISANIATLTNAISPTEATLPIVANSKNFTCGITPSDVAYALGSKTFTFYTSSLSKFNALLTIDVADSSSGGNHARLVFNASDATIYYAYAQSFVVMQGNATVPVVLSFARTNLGNMLYKIDVTATVPSDKYVRCNYVRYMV